MGKINFDETNVGSKEVREILSQFIGTNRLEEATLEVSDAINCEKKYYLVDLIYFVHLDDNSNPVATKKPVIGEALKKILKKYCVLRDINECIPLLLAVWRKRVGGLEDWIKAFRVPGTNELAYEGLLGHIRVNDAELVFQDRLSVVLNEGLEGFSIPVCDPSRDDGVIVLEGENSPAISVKFNEWIDFARKNALQIGTVNQYVLFLGYLILKLIENGWSEDNAWHAVCCDSKELGRYADSETFSDVSGLTGQINVCGKCDLANTKKLLYDSDERYAIAGGSAQCSGSDFPLAKIEYEQCFNSYSRDAVAWLVF